MAAQSKLSLSSFLSEAGLRRLLNTTASKYLQHRTKISRAIYLTLFLALVSRVRNAISEQKAASARQTDAKRRPTTGSSEGGDATARKKVELNREFFKSLFR